MLRRFCTLVLLLAVSGTMPQARVLSASPPPVSTDQFWPPSGFAPLLRHDTATLRGRVTNATGDPLAGAQLLLLGTQIRLVTDQDGSFARAGLPAGVRELEIRSLGYETQRVRVELQPGEAISLSVALASRPIDLDGVHVDASRSRNAFGGFYERRARGPGYFITREEIDRHRPRQLSDLLRLVPGLRLNPGSFGTFDVEVSRARTGATACHVQVYLNGVRHSNAGLTNLDGLRVTEIEGVEIYRNPGEVPGRFRAPNAACGVIAIWIREGAPVRRGGS